MSSRWSKNSNSSLAIDTAENKDNLFKNDICTQFCRELHKKLLDRFDFLESIDDDMYAIGSKLMSTRSYYINFKKNDYFDGIDFRWTGKTGDSNNTFIICLRLALNEKMKTKFIQYTKSHESDDYYITTTNNVIRCCINLENFPYENFTDMDSHSKIVNKIDKLYNNIVNLLQNYTSKDKITVTTEAHSSTDKDVKDEPEVYSKEKRKEVRELCNTIVSKIETDTSFMFLGDRLSTSIKTHPKTSRMEIILNYSESLNEKVGFFYFVIGFKLIENLIIFI